jgi:hypothetical protein
MKSGKQLRFVEWETFGSSTSKKLPNPSDSGTIPEGPTMDLGGDNELRKEHTTLSSDRNSTYFPLSMGLAARLSGAELVQ